MKVIAKCIANCIFRFEETKEETIAAVDELTKRFPLYE